MNHLHNIFSTKKEKINPLINMIVDTREKNSLVFTNLIKNKANPSFQKLEVGDYLIQDILIERKTFPDFISCILNKRLFSQLIDLSKYEKRLIILEGFDYNYSKSSIHENAIRGTLLSITLDFNTPIIYTKDESDTSSFLIHLARKMTKSKSLHSIRPTKTLKNKRDQKRFILEGFPGIGPTISKSLLDKFKTLKKIFNSPKKELSSIPKFNEIKVNNFLNLLKDQEKI